MGLGRHRLDLNISKKFQLKIDLMYLVSEEGLRNITKNYQNLANRLHTLTKQLEVTGTPVGSSESLCMKFNGVTGVDKCGREFVPVTITVLGSSQVKEAHLLMGWD